MKRILFMIVLLGIIFLTSACSSDSGSSESSDKAADSTEQNVAVENSNSFTGTTESGSDEQKGATEDKSSQEGEVIQTDRKVIYTANLHIEVKSYQDTVNEIQTEATNRGGYIVESNMYGGSENGSTSGQITVRIPQEQFREFIQLVEDGSNKVIESSISGQDVTEEYVDLESRLKSKRVVEERLLSFMEQAEKTEDLLTISEDLAVVQGEIEEIMGRMKYLQNKADLATVTIHIQEKNVAISGVGEDELNTWEETKQQFFKSINWLISAFSGLFIFFIGNLPILLLIGVVGLIAFMIYKKRKRNDQKE